MSVEAWAATHEPSRGFGLVTVLHSILQLIELWTVNSDLILIQAAFQQCLKTNFPPGKISSIVEFLFSQWYIPIIFRFHTDTDLLERHQAPRTDRGLLVTIQTLLESHGRHQAIAAPPPLPEVDWAPGELPGQLWLVQVRGQRRHRGQHRVIPADRGGSVKY